MSEHTKLTLKGIRDLTEEDRVSAFLEDLQALNELAAVVHKKALEGDNAAGHLDVKIRDRKASMFGYDSPVQFDMTLLATRREKSTAPFDRALQFLAEQVPAHHRDLVNRVHRGELDYLAEPVIESEPALECASACTSEPDEPSKP
jgi:hypothetical protein